GIWYARWKRFKFEEGVRMLQKLTADCHTQPFKGPFSVTRIQPSAIFTENTRDSAFGPLSTIDHAVMSEGLTVKMHEHVNDEIFSYVFSGTSYHKDSDGFEVPLTPGKLMMMNAGSGFKHEEMVKEGQVEMLQIFVRPDQSNLKPMIQFHDKPSDQRDWYVMVGPKSSDAPIIVRNNVYIFDAHPKSGDTLNIPEYEGYQPFLYVLDGEISVNDITLGKQEAVTDLDDSIPPLTVHKDATLVLFLVDLQSTGTLDGTI